jgi:hypothetical protein
MEPLLLLELASAHDAGANMLFDRLALCARERSVDQPGQELERAGVR